MRYFVYILASRKEGALYIGVTNNLVKRVFEHKNKLVDSHTKKYNETMLVFFEETNSVESAIIREKQLKKWKRVWKIELIENENPEWKDLYKEIIK